jgi:hypothetical protein
VFRRRRDRDVGAAGRVDPRMRSDRCERVTHRSREVDQLPSVGERPPDGLSSSHALTYVLVSRPTCSR